MDPDAQWLCKTTINGEPSELHLNKAITVKKYLLFTVTQSCFVFVVFKRAPHQGNTFLQTPGQL